MNSGSTVTLTFVSARFSPSLLKNNRMSPQYFFFSQHSVVLKEIGGRDMNALQILFFMNLSHMSCVRITDMKDSCEFVRVLHRSEGFARICHR